MDAEGSGLIVGRGNDSPAARVSASSDNKGFSPERGPPEFFHCGEEGVHVYVQDAAHGAL
jgi:hypothetical protein